MMAANCLNDPRCGPSGLANGKHGLGLTGSFSVSVEKKGLVGVADITIEVR